jgi:Fanconi anemia group J protein
VLICIELDAFFHVFPFHQHAGKTPRWEAHLHLDLLTPGPLMQELSNECRTIVLASGSLSPIPSLCAELNLFPADSPISPIRSSEPDTTNSLPKVEKRLQNHPCPLEADHVVDLEKQLFAVSIGHFPDGSELRVAQKNYTHPEFLHKLGDCLVRIVDGIAEGGVLVFLPSYSLLRKCERLWNPNSYRQNRRAWWQNEEIEPSSAGPTVFDRLRKKKHNVIVEPSGDQDAFEEKRQEYMETVRTKGGCVLLAVFRGKMSEGISFNDNNARGVVCIGVPLPSAFALPIKVKMDYNEEQRKLRGRTDLLPGREWYNQQAYRAVAQALGRCIRHVSLLLDTVSQLRVVIVIQLSAVKYA